MKQLWARTCVLSLAVTASLLAVAQSLPVFGTARFELAESEFKSTKLCALLLALSVSLSASAEELTITFDGLEYQRFGNDPSYTSTLEIDGYVFTPQGDVKLFTLPANFEADNSPPSNTSYFTSEYSSGENKFSMTSSSGSAFSLCSFDAAPIYGSDAAQLVVHGTTAQGSRTASFSIPADPGVSPWSTFDMPLWQEVTELSFTYGDNYIGLENFVLNSPVCVDSDGDGVANLRDYYPYDASRTVQEIPTLPLFGLVTLAGLLGLFGLRQLRQ